MKLLQTAALSAGAALMLAATGAGAVTFASFSAIDDNANLSLTGTSLSASSPVSFSFLTVGLSKFGPLSAILRVNAVETDAARFGSVEFGRFYGNFAFIYTGPATTVGSGKYKLTIKTGQTLLSGRFKKALLKGKGGEGGVRDSTLSGSVVFNSPFYTFSRAKLEEFNLSLSAVTPSFDLAAPHRLANFTAISEGTFTTAVPEPATWTLMLTGFGLMGAGLRARRRSAQTAV